MDYTKVEKLLAPYTGDKQENFFYLSQIFQNKEANFTFYNEISLKITSEPNKGSLYSAKNIIQFLCQDFCPCSHSNDSTEQTNIIACHDY